jgi:hypothetical protein
MSTFKSKLGAGLVALALGSAALVTAGPAMAGGFHRHGGWGHHGGGWGHGHRWGFGYVGYAPAYYGGCYVKKTFVPYHGVFIKKVCY